MKIVRDFTDIPRPRAGNGGSMVGFNQLLGSLASVKAARIDGEISLRNIVPAPKANEPIDRWRQRVKQAFNRHSVRHGTALNTASAGFVY